MVFLLMMNTRYRSIPLLLALFIFMIGVVNIATAIYLIFHLNHYFHVDQYAAAVVDTTKFRHGSDFIMLFLGLLLIKLGHGLFKQYHMSWFWAMLLTVLSILNSLVPPITWHIFGIDLLYLLLLYLYRQHFYRIDNHVMSYQKAIAWLSVFFAIAYGVLGSYFFRAQFFHLDTWVDAFYFTLATYSTVGYGDIYPLTPDAKIFTMSMILIGVASFLTALSVLLGPIIQKNIRGVYKIMSNFSRLNHHVLLCGDNVMTRALATRYTQAGKMCFFLEADPVVAANLEAAKFNVVRVNPEDTEALLQVNMAKAICLVVAYSEDARNILVAMSAQAAGAGQKDNSCQVIVRIEEPHNIEKARRAGAFEVVSPLIMGADWIAAQVV